VQVVHAQEHVSHGGILSGGVAGSRRYYTLSAGGEQGYSVI
jgi:hypothetical protein